VPTPYRIIKRMIKILILLLVLTVVYINYHVTHTSRGRLFDKPEDLPYNKMALLLGTSPRLSTGGENPFFTYRVKAAADIFKAGRVEYIIASGNKEDRYYNEPEALRKALVELGVPSERVLLDEKGYRTLDSILRCREIFQQESYTIVSQKFHNQRALFLGLSLGANPVGYNARDVEITQGAKTLFREVFARIKAFIDLYVYRSGR